MDSGMVSIDTVVKLASEQIEHPDGVLSIFAGGVYWENWNQFEEGCGVEGEHNLSRLLELRVYSSECEFHALRDSIDQSRVFSWRTVYDDDFDAHLDDVQLLDIDAKQSNPAQCLYRATGGGEYSLPVANAERIHLRNYMNYDDQGIAHIVDFRIVGLLKEGE